MVDSFVQLSELFPDRFMDGFEMVAFIDSSTTDTQCMVLRNARLKQVRCRLHLLARRTSSLLTLTRVEHVQYNSAGAGSPQTTLLQLRSGLL